MNISELLRDNNFKFNKQFGQNFITDVNLLQAMVSDSGITPDDVVVEIGAGAGTLTRQLAGVAKKVYAFEIDKNLVPVLSQSLKGLDDKVEIIFQDFQKVSEEQLLAMTGAKYKVVANLPYYITTPLIMRFLESNIKPQSITVMIQKEVGERIVSKEGNSDYGVITLAIALEGDARITRIVPKTLFIPEPKVDSCIVRIDLSDKYDGVDKSKVKRVIRAGFAMRRKTLVNNLVQMGVDKKRAEEALTLLGLDVRIRGESLSLEQYISLSDVLQI